MRRLPYNYEKSSGMDAKTTRMVDVKCQEIKSQEQRLHKTKKYGGKSCGNSAKVNREDFKFSRIPDLFTR
jgi:hypothetical protein